MVDTQKIEMQKIGKSRISEVDFNDLPFGKVFADHMFLADYRDGEWKNLRVMPYGTYSSESGNAGDPLWPINF